MQKLISRRKFLAFSVLFLFLSLRSFSLFLIGVFGGGLRLNSNFFDSVKRLFRSFCGVNF